ncbi:hypothetical protein SAMN06265784_106293 [Paraburkholderia susongensis]|uniref:Uncharacterized protein n=1 Tax=Paraburkholderia susongensis TaxID=1515439 RepID=A0A1X7LL83_9BURK|nr:hypothetical protein SAMN06265784_106293 [Paraburkholderia susongensis]
MRLSHHACQKFNLMRRLKVDWVTQRSCAEREKLSVLARLTKSSSHFSSMLCASYQGSVERPLGQAWLSAWKTISPMPGSTVSLAETASPSVNTASV